MKPNIRRDYSWNTAGVLIQNAISPLLLLVVTRVNGINDSGLFSFAFAVSVILWSVALWGGRTFQVSDHRKEFSYRGYVVVRLILAVVVIVSSIAFVIINGYSAEKSYLIILLTAVKVVEAIADVLYGILQVHGKLYITGLSLLLKNVLSFVVFTIMLIMTKNLLISSTMLLLCNVGIVLFYDLPWVYRVTHGSISRGSIHIGEITSEALTIMKKTSPVFAMGILSILSVNIPRYFVDKYHESQIGYFGILVMPITLLTLLITFILQPNIVELSKQYAEGKSHDFSSKLKKITKVIVLFEALIFIGAIVIGIPVLNLLFGLRFDNYRAALTIVLVGAIANTIVGILANALTVMRHFREQFIALLSMNILLTVGCAMLVPRHGLTMAVSLYSSANIIQAALLYVIYKKHLLQQ